MPTLRPSPVTTSPITGLLATPSRHDLKIKNRCRKHFIPSNSALMRSFQLLIMEETRAKRRITFNRIARDARIEAKSLMLIVRGSDSTSATTLVKLAAYFKREIALPLKPSLPDGNRLFDTKS
jgi:hypothetical protein